MAPLAGKPPFATDEPDSFYDSSPAPRPRVRQQPPPDPNARTSAYNIYNNYVGDDKNKLAAPAEGAANRNSGIGNLLMNMDDDSDSDDDDDDVRRKPGNPPGINASPASKNAALAAAVNPTRPSPPPPPQPQQQRPPQQQQSPPQMRQAPPPPAYQQQMRGPSPQPIAAPRPGYAAPIAALNLARPDAVAKPAGRGPPPPITIQNPFEPSLPSPGRPAYAPPASPASSVHSSTPHPLLPPVTPIVPVFVRPAKSSEGINIKFEEGVAIPRKPKAIMRGNSEETLLPSRGEKGDDFWRRFSIVAKEENKSRGKESSWLRKTRGGAARYSRWVWVVGVFLILCIAGGIGFGLYATRNSPGHQMPTAIGGSADNAATFSTAATTAAGKTAAAKSSSTFLHVSPTNTVARREASPEPTDGVAPVLMYRASEHHHKRRLDMDTW